MRKITQLLTWNGLPVVLCNDGSVFSWDNSSLGWSEYCPIPQPIDISQPEETNMFDGGLLDKCCERCGLPIKYCNPSGQCNHLYYPKNINKSLNKGTVLPWVNKLV